MTLLITGGTGSLGSKLVKRFSPSYAPTRAELDIRMPVSQSRFYDETSEGDRKSIDTVIHCAALLNRACEDDNKEAMRTNILGTAHIADFCYEVNAKLVFISTEYVFRGDRGGYAPCDDTVPINYYGRTKVAGETIARSLPSSLIIRVAFLPETFPYSSAFTDLISSKLPLPQAVDEIVSLIENGESGIHHVCGPIRSIYEYTQEHHPDQDIQPACCEDGVIRPINASMVKR